ncbi:MAG: hypothetical protein JWR07_1501 [Nevskia sp.]|nr:hypothetical protein [Nevskia sp.]
MLRWMTKLIAVAALSQLFAGSALADLGGCVDSPENPTAVLGLLGAAAAGMPWVKAKLAARRGKRDPQA